MRLPAMLRRPHRRFGWPPARPDPKHWGIVCCVCNTPLVTPTSCGCSAWFMKPQPEIGAKVWHDEIRGRVGTIANMSFDRILVRWDNGEVTAEPLDGKWHRGERK